MDAVKLVSKKLLQKDKCVAALKGSYLDNDEKCPSIVSLVENVDGHCVFLYILEKPNPSSSSDLELFKVMEVDLDFKYSADASNNQLNFTNAKQTFHLETSSSEKMEAFVDELERAGQIHTQNAVFAVPSFSWIDKYLFPTTTTTTNSNPNFVDNKASTLQDPLIQFEDTTTTNALESTDGWPFNEIIQLDAGQPCPVVKDNTIHGSLVNTNQSNSLVRTNGRVYNNHVNDLAWQNNRGERAKVKPDITGNFISYRKDINVPSMNSRETLAAFLMKEREVEYTELHGYRVFCGTWNVNGQNPAMEMNLKKWLMTKDWGGDYPDIFAVGFQEIDPGKNLFIVNETQREQEWIETIQQNLPPHYVLLKATRLVAILLIVYVKDSLKNHIKDVMAGRAATGFMGMLGNKGGVAIRFRLRDTTICFVNSHLCAHTEEWLRRNQDYRDINAKLIFQNSNMTSSEMFIPEHDMVFWFGDLNYRISDIETEDCKSYIVTNKLHDLVNFDQLSRQMSLKRVFLGYFEGPLTFQPTYKFNPGTNTWDTVKQRTPAWCDRVLWKGENIEQKFYQSHPELNLSDHKPVSGVFVIKTKVYKKEQEKVVRQQVMKYLDQQENQLIPQVEIESTDKDKTVIFKDMKCLDVDTKPLILRNTGHVPAMFEFVNKPNESNFCKPWLRVDPSDGLIQTNNTFDIQLEVQINSRTILEEDSKRGRKYLDTTNAGEGSSKDYESPGELNDVLVLRLQGGKDIFITVLVYCKPSCFGLPLGLLVQLYQPVAVSLDDNLNIKTKSHGKPLDIPKELWFLVDYLFRHGLDKEELFQQLGVESQILAIRDILDNSTGGLEGGKFNIESVAEALLIFLDCLPVPVVPQEFYEACLDSTSLQNSFQIVKNFPACHRNVFKYICAFLREFVAKTAKSDARVLSHVFGAVILKPLKTVASFEALSKSAEENNKKATFLQNFILSDHDYEF